MLTDSQIWKWHLLASNLGLRKYGTQASKLSLYDEAEYFLTNHPRHLPPPDCAREAIQAQAKADLYAMTLKSYRLNSILSLQKGTGGKQQTRGPG